jgi:hypothetical protein
MVRPFGSAVTGELQLLPLNVSAFPLTSTIPMPSPFGCSGQVRQRLEQNSTCCR